MASSLLRGLASARHFLWVLVLLGLGLRCLTSVHPYSGQNNPPMYGDYEAQRHFMEVTFQLPVSQWYRYDLQYWGLDYPPLTAYHSYLLGAISHWIDPEWVALDTSRGHESPAHKLFMRWSALLSDFFIYGSSIFLLLGALRSHEQTRHSLSDHRMLVLLLMLNPTLIVIDHGHFQYNAVMLGFFILSISRFVERQYGLGAVAFCLSIGFKHMALYYSLAIFFYLLGLTLLRQKSILQSLHLLVVLATSVVMTFSALLLSFKLFGSWDDVQQVFVRLFPVSRGLYEDKVANVWCALSVIIKLRDRFDIPTLVRISAITTLVSCLPSCMAVFRKGTYLSLIYALGAVSLAFFLFSFQVHEKSILLPTVPIIMLYLDEPVLVDWFVNTAMFSMYHTLLEKDRLLVPYISLLIVWNMLTGSPSLRAKSTVFQILIKASYLAMLLIHVLAWALQAPAKLPDLYVVANVLVSTSVFIVVFLYLTIAQWSNSYTNRPKVKKH